MKRRHRGGATGTHSSRSRRTIALLLTSTLAAIGSLVVAMSSTPAQAASGCAGYRGPYWFAALDATMDTGQRKVLAVEPPRTSGAHSYIWGYNGELGQKWCLERFYEPVPDVVMYRFRLAEENRYCLGGSATSGAWLSLRLCTASGTMKFRQYTVSNNYDDPIDDINYQKYRFKLWPSETLCLDVYNGDSANGTHVILWTCNGLNNQNWY